MVRVPPRRRKFTGWQPYDGRSRNLFGSRFCQRFLGQSLDTVSLAHVPERSIPDLQHALANSALSIPFSTL
eukprot:14819740-Alexandrium_andersonii.AAC.1